MTWNQWYAQFGLANQVRLRNLVTAVGGAISPVNSSADEIFRALCEHGRQQYIYVEDASVGGGICSALEKRLLNCQNASHLMVGVFLFRNQGDDPNVGLEGIQGGNMPIVTPPIDPAVSGLEIHRNVHNDAAGTLSPRMLFTGGHWLARIGQTRFDLCCGRSGLHLAANYLTATRVDNQRYTCVIGGQTRTFNAIGGTTVGGLREFRVAPPLQ